MGKGRVLGRESNLIILRYFKKLTVLTVILFFSDCLFVCFLSHGQEPISYEAYRGCLFSQNMRKKPSNLVIV